MYDVNNDSDYELILQLRMTFYRITEKIQST